MPEIERDNNTKNYAKEMKNSLPTGERNRLEATLEIAMMSGNVLQMDDISRLEYAVYYMARTINGEEAAGKALEQFREAVDNLDESSKIIGLSTCRVYNMPCINILTALKDDPDFKIDDDEDGVFCYVINLNDPMYSEFGYSFFEQRGKNNDSGVYHRIS